jgi:hypothetical protein
MAQGGQSYRDRPKTMKPQTIKRQAGEGGGGLNVVSFLVGLCIPPGLGIAVLVPGMLLALGSREVVAHWAGNGDDNPVHAVGMSNDWPNVHQNQQGGCRRLFNRTACDTDHK